MAGIQVVKPGTRELDSATATKIAPPLTIPEDALRESLAVFEEACAEVLG